MHILAARPGGFVDDAAAGVVRVAQTPGDIVVLSAADTTLALLAETAEALPDGHPSVRLANLMALRQPASVDLYVDDVLCHARAVVIDHLGAPSDWAYLVERAWACARQRGQWLALFSGDAQEDPQLLLRSTASADDCRMLWRYLREGGRVNAQRFWALIRHRVWGTGAPPPAPEPMPAVFAYTPARESAAAAARDGPGQALLLFYRAHALAGNTAVFDALWQALRQRGLRVSALAVDSLKSVATQQALRALSQREGVDVVLNATGFASGRLDGVSTLLDGLVGDAPVLQLITAGTTVERWRDDPHGLTPRDHAMHVVMPEVDGRIITRAISGKSTGWRSGRAEVEVARYEPIGERIEWVAELARRWCALRRGEPAQQRLALILANYPGEDSRIGHAVGLDTPASVVAILRALQRAGYTVGDVPDGAELLMQRLLAGVTHSVPHNAVRAAHQSLALQDYHAALATLPPPLREQLTQRWGPPERDPMVRRGRFLIPGVRLGNVFVGIQPPRAYGVDRVRSYHDATLVPTHAYVAFYVWLRQHWRVDALVHVGKHGSLEWLPGKTVALSDGCWPDAILGPLPHLYPFIVNDPGEGCQAKRRTQAVIIDHLMPPLTRAETYGPLQALERRMDEYYEAVLLDPARAQRLQQQLLQEALQHRLHTELGMAPPRDEAQRMALLQRLDAYLCEIKETQIRSGLHIFGQSPRGEALWHTVLALVRFPRGASAGEDSLLRALAADLGLTGYDPLQGDATQPWSGPRPAELQAVSTQPWRHAGHTRERLERLALQCLRDPSRVDALAWPRTAAVLGWVQEVLLPRLALSGVNEMAHLLAGLRGRFVPPGPSGAPSRGRADVLPTGRNFYAVDTRAVPTPTAWSMGQQAAQRLLERHVQEHGMFPQCVGMTVWGTSTMRTGGEDMAEALALLGVRPRWADGSGRVVDVEVVPAAVLGRPRVDVTLRISGFFRDAFPALIDLFDTAVQAVAAISEEEEPDELNPVRGRIQREQRVLQAQGEDAQRAWRVATWRVFGPNAGDYRNGVQERIESGQWHSSHDLAQAYVQAGGYAYGRDGHALPARAAFERRLAALDVVLQNQDNREHDILDSDGYYPFLGGMGAASAALRGQPVALYHGDMTVPGAPRVQPLAHELARVVRARALNPQWLEAMREHGYKGAAEMVNTVELLFGFAATTGLVHDHQFALLAEAYVLDEQNRRFLQRHNAQALRQMGLRLLEAAQRGLWRDGGDCVERIRDVLLAQEEAWEQSIPATRP